MPIYRALLCDLDGTLADSEPLHCDAWLTVLAENHNLHFDGHWFEQFIGTHDETVADQVVANHDIGVTARELVGEKKALFHRKVRSSATSFPRVPALLARISADFPVAIATNSNREDAELMVEGLGFGAYAKVLVTATDVAHRKPAPDIFATAARELGVPAGQCIAIEDSGPGAESARAAGCYVIGLTERAAAAADELIEDQARALERAERLLRASE